jgi:hypothetical protein
MTVRTPSPLAAAVGLAAEATDQLRKLPGLLGSARERYDELARHGRDVLTGHREPAPPTPVEVVLEPATALPEPVPPLGRTEPVTIPDEVLDEVAQLTPGGELDHADLPLADFDHQTVPQLRGRLRTLELPELIQLRDYEQAHARRLPVLTLLDNRIARLAEPASPPPPAD